MQTPQKPIKSGLSHQSTAGDVIRDINLKGKTAIVTGGYSGLGLETAKALTKAGAKVVVPARNFEKAKAALNGISNIEIRNLDLTDPTSIERFSSDFLRSHESLEILINGAGIMASPLARDSRGYEMQFSANHLGHFHLTAKLMPALVKAKGSRVVSVSSSGHQLSDIRWTDVNFSDGYDKWLAYGQSKTANALFAVHLDEIGKDFGVRAFSLHPGKILTPLQRHLEKKEMIEAGWIDKDGNLADPDFKSIEQGAATAVWAATSPQLDGRGGVYCEDCDIAPFMNPKEQFGFGVNPWAADRKSAIDLWKISEKLLGVSFAITK